MFIKVFSKNKKSTGDQRLHYRLCESYRTETSVRHYNILYLGILEELPTIEQKKSLCYRLGELVKESRTGKQNLFSPGESIIEKLAQKFFLEIKNKKRLDFSPNRKYQKIDIDTIENKNIREVGTEWLCLQALEQLNVKYFLQTQDWTEEQIHLALTHIISRATYPASELRTSSWIQDNSAVCELTGYPVENITKDKLYGISHKLFEVKDRLEKHLSRQTNELFDLEDKIILYDLTNTYFEGSMRNNAKAKFGRSKEKRSDARLIVLAVVVNVEGFLKYSQIFEGNITDSKTLVKIIEELSQRTSSLNRNPVIVLDAGIATEDNLILLKQNGFDYMCVSRSSKKAYTIDTQSNPVEIKDKKEQSLTLQKIIVTDSSDTYLRVHSKAKAMKEGSMESRFSQKFEDGLQKIKTSLSKKSGIKTPAKVWERIGRLKATYPSIHNKYDLKLKTQNEKIIEIGWEKKKIANNDGYYLLRTTLSEKDEHTQWQIYNTIREIEATFRILKTDLDLRPIFHKTEQAGMAHLHLGLLAYWVVNTIRYQLKQKGIKNEWRDIIRIMNTQKMVTTTMKNEYEQEIVIRQCSEPEAQVKQIYQALNYKPKPFSRIKFVVPPNETAKPLTQQYEAIKSG